jgi:hypothetical protein
MFNVHFLRVVICDLQGCALRYTSMLTGSLAKIASEFGAEIGTLVADLSNYLGMLMVTIK